MNDERLVEIRTRLYDVYLRGADLPRQMIDDVWDYIEVLRSEKNHVIANHADLVERNKLLQSECDRLRFQLENNTVIHPSVIEDAERWRVVLACGVYPRHEPQDKQTWTVDVPVTVSLSGNNRADFTAAIDSMRETRKDQQ